MRSKSFLILAATTALAVAGAVASVYQRQAGHVLPSPPAALFPGLLEQVNQVAQVVVVSPQGTFTIDKKPDGNWEMAEKGGYPVPYETIKQAVVGLAGMRPLEAKTAVPGRYPKLKLVDPRDSGSNPGSDPDDELTKGTLIRLSDGTGSELAALIVGKIRSIQTTGREGWFYVREPAKKQSWLASARLEVFDKASAWLDSETVRVARPRIRAVGNRQPDGQVVEISRPDPDQIDFKVDNLPKGSKMIHDTVANSLGSALGFLSFDDVAPAAELDFSKAVRATFRTFDGLVVTVDVIKVARKYWARFHATFDAAEVRLDAVGEKHRDKMKSADEVGQEAERINRRFGIWAYNVPKYKAVDFTTPMKKLAVLEPPKAKK